MDAQLVWNTWRRVLTSDELVDWVMRPDSRGAEPAGLTEDELAILAEYAETPVATDSNIGMYRRGLVRNALGSLNLVPLSRRLLDASGLDPEATAAGFCQVVGYLDYGPNFWRTAAEFIGYLSGLPEFGSAGQQAVLALDAATTALVRRLGESVDPVWPDDSAAGPPESPSARYVANPAAIVVSSSCDLTSWIEQPFSFDPDEELPTSTRHWLVYLPGADAAPDYAALSARAARCFELLSTPGSALELSQAVDGLTPDDAAAVIGSLAGLGVLLHSDQLRSGDRPFEDAYVLLDPAVEVLPIEIDEHRLLVNGHSSVGMVVPPGDGLLAFVRALAERPVEVSLLRTRFDDQQLVDQMLGSLRQHGFLHVTSAETPPAAELAMLREQAEENRLSSLRRSEDVDLDQPGALERAAQVCARDPAPELLLRCAELAPHAGLIAELARLRQTGTVRMHSTVVRTTDLRGADELARSLLRLGACVQLDGLPWPAPAGPVPGLAELTGNRVAVHAIQQPDLSILDPRVRGRALDWARAQFVSGLCLRLEPDLLWPTGDAEQADYIELFEAVRAIEDEFGDVQILDLPSDEVLLGNTALVRSDSGSTGLVERFRLAYLRWRVPILKSCENDNSWSQLPEVEDKLVRAGEDLLPNNPELLLLRPGSTVVDVCGGLGRVARRLSPAVGEDGMVISIEMFRCLSDRARRFACERGFTNLHFRPGLAQRLPLPDGTVDAAVNEWTGAIWELGIGPAMIAEMARVVRPGGRIAITHRLVQLQLSSLGQPWVQYEQIYRWLRDALDHPDLRIVTERVWGQIVPSLVGESATRWRKQYMPRLIDPFQVVYTQDANPDTCADVYLTIIAQRQ